MVEIFENWNHNWSYISFKDPEVVLVVKQDGQHPRKNATFQALKVILADYKNIASEADRSE